MKNKSRDFRKRTEFPIYDDTGSRIKQIFVNYEKAKKQQWVLAPKDRFQIVKKTWNVSCDFCGLSDVFMGKLPGPRRPFVDTDKNGFGPMLESKKMGLKAHQKCLW